MPNASAIVDAMSNASAIVATMSNASAMHVGEQVCSHFHESVAMVAFTIPGLCEDIKKGDMSWMGVFCWPFWDYDAAQMLIIFGLLLALRKYAFRKKFEWLAHKIKPRREAEPVRDHSLKSSAGYLINSGAYWTRDFTIRCVLQSLQWWLFAIALLIFLLFSELSYVRDMYGVQVNYVLHPGVPQQLASIPAWLATFSMYSYAALGIIYALSLLSIAFQVITNYTEKVLECRVLFEAGAAFTGFTRDTALQVLLLPMVYGLMAAKNVSGTWSAMTDNAPPALRCFDWTPAQVRQIQSDVYDSNFSLADMYEAWALTCFAHMLSKVLREELQKKIRLEALSAFEQLMLIDVRVFNVVAGTGAMFSILLTWSKFRLGHDMCAAYPSICSFQIYLLAANWCSSSIAIYNLYTIETTFEGLATMRKFQPKLKFYSIKLMVFVAFWMTLVMAVVKDVCQLTDDETRLLDSSFRIYVMCFVSILNLKAWWPWSSWYSILDKREEGLRHQRILDSETGREKPLLDDVGHYVVPPGVTALVKQLLSGLTASSPSTPSAQFGDFEQVKEQINSLDEQSLCIVLHRGSQIGWAVPPRSFNKANQRKPMMDLCHEDRKDALLQHLQGFYPER